MNDIFVTYRSKTCHISTSVIVMNGGVFFHHMYVDVM